MPSIGLNENFIRRSLLRSSSFDPVPLESFSPSASTLSLSPSPSSSSSSLWLFICFMLSWMNLRVCWQLTYLGYCLLLKSRHINSFDYTLLPPPPSASIQWVHLVFLYFYCGGESRRECECVSISLDKMDNRSHSMCAMDSYVRPFIQWHEMKKKKKKKRSSRSWRA